MVTPSEVVDGTEGAGVWMEKLEFAQQSIIFEVAKSSRRVGTFGTMDFDLKR